MPASAPESQITSRAFQRDEGGAIAIIFALSIMVVMLVTGLAIDVGRLMHAERTLASAIDAAALAAAKAMKASNLTDDEVQSVAQRYFDANMTGHGAGYQLVQSFSVSVNRATNSIGVDVRTDVPTIFANLAGIPKFEIPKSTVAIFDTKNIEIGLQLDVTGSMCSPCTKIDALKDAIAGAGGLLDILLPDSGSGNEVKIGLAPFAAGVNAGDYIAAVAGGRTPGDRCVYERNDLGLQATDTSPAGAGRFKVRSELPGANACPSSRNRVVGLTDSKSTLRTAVEGLTTGGYTAGHLGTAWAWGLVSPEWARVWGGTPPAAYNDGRTEKYVILMTDGVYNTVGGQSNGDYGSTATQSQGYAQGSCTAMKAKGVIVFTIGFQVPNAAKPGLRSCASDTSKFYDAASEETLRAAFRAIAEEINNLRLSS